MSKEYSSVAKWGAIIVLIANLGFAFPKQDTTVIGKPTVKQQEAIRSLAAKAGERLHVAWNEQNGTVSFLKGTLTKPRIGDARLIAQEFLQTNREVFKIENPQEEFLSRKVDTDRLGMQHVRFRQVYQVIPVWGSEIIVHLDSQGAIKVVNGNYFPTPRIATDYSISQSQALEAAKRDLAHMGEYRLPPAAELVIYDHDNEFHLTWKVRLTIWAPPGDWLYFIDAHTGAILHKYNDLKFDGPALGSGVGLDNQTKPLHTYLDQGMYWLADASRPMYSPPLDFSSSKGLILTYDALNQEPQNGSVVVYLIHDPNNDNMFNDQSNLKAAVDAHYHAGMVHEYFQTTFHRNSWDDAGATTRTAVHYGQNYNNAFSGGGWLVFGDGDGVSYGPFSAAFDIVAHEWTHGITDATANLVYENQSGALNESYSDVFAVLVDTEDWLIGEDVYTPSIPGDAIRSLEDPARFGQPAHMSGYQKLPPDSDHDNGGVHTNSGIPNKAFYNIASIIGREKAGNIYYRTLALYLTPLAQFVDARNATLQACDDLYGLPSPEYNAVENGCNAVGIGPGSGGFPETQLPNGVPINGTIGLQEYKLYYLDVPDSVATCTIKTTNTTGDAVDLYVAIDEHPTHYTYDYAAFSTSGNETITVWMGSSPPIRSGRLFVLVAAWDGGSYTLTATYQTAQVVYVNVNATGANDGTSWANAFTRIQAGIDAADPQDKWVWVAKGTYRENITLKYGVAVFGGFKGTESSLGERDFLQHKTVINGGGSGPVVIGENRSLVDGFTITNGNGISGGGVSLSNRKGPTIRNNIITGNRASWGGGIYHIGSFVEPDPIIVNNVISGNDASLGDGLYFNNSWASVWNNTIVSNRGEGINAIGFYSPSPDIRNCIVWGNGDDLAQTAYATYSDIEDGDQGSGNISADPQFVDPASGDYHLRAGSPCIDAGDPNTRKDPDGTRADMGAFYFDQPRVIGAPDIVLSSMSLDFGIVALGDTATKVLAIFNRGTETLSVTSIVSSSGAFSVDRTVVQVEPGTQQSVFISFLPSAIGTFTGALTIASNDPDEASVVVNLSGSGGAAPPAIAVTPQSFAVFVNQGESINQTLKIMNRGGSDLTFQIKKTNSGSSEETFGNKSLSFSGGSRMRGNVYYIAAPTVLTESRMRLNITTSTSLRFVVYRGATISGDFVKDSEVQVTSLGTGEGWYSSGSINVDLEAGKYYYIGVAWSGSVTYYLGDMGSPLSASFGTLEYGSEENVYPPPTTYNPDDDLSHNPYYQTIVTGGANWIQESISFGTIAPAGDQSIALTFDAATLAAGSYHATLTVISNDPNEGRVYVPVDLTVQAGGGVQPPSAPSDLVVSRSGNSVVLNWSAVSNATSYKVYRSAEPYFTPNTPYATVTTPGYTDANVLGNPAVNYFYVVTAANAGGESPISNRVGEFDFELITTPTTDFNEIALPLKISGVTTASGLMAAIPNCNSVARWNASTQGYDQYIPVIPPTNFAVSAGYPYYVNVTANTVFTLVGEYATPSFNLITTPTTDFNEIMLPLNRTDVTTAFQLMAAIPNCNSVAKWNAQTQGYDQYIPAIPPTNFAVRVGYPYYVNVTANVVWPAGSALAGVDSTGWSLSLGKGERSETLSSKAPHAVYGQVEIVGDSLLAKGGLSFTVYILSRPSEKLTDSSPGCSLSDGRWVVQCASFPTAWQAGEVLHIEFKSRTGLLLGSTECTLTYEPTDNAGKIVLSPEAEAIVPKVFSLSQNYPNPFNLETEIGFALPKVSHVTLKIYNVTGQLVKTLIDDEKEAGLYKVRWNARNNEGKDMASGMYFCLLVASGYTKSIKLLLLK